MHDDPDEPYGGAKHRPHGVHGGGGGHPPPYSRQVSLAHRRVVLGQQQVVGAAAAAHPAHVPQHRDQVQGLLPDPRAGNVVRLFLSSTATWAPGSVLRRSASTAASRATLAAMSRGPAGRSRILRNAACSRALE